jgi:hypothetical protein
VNSLLIAVDAKTSQQGINRVQLRVLKKPCPELKIRGERIRGIHLAASAFPEAATPEGRFLLNV